MPDITLVNLIAILFLVDSLGALWVAYLGERWYLHHVGIFARYFPPAKGWAVLYFLLALFATLLAFGML